MSKSILVVDDSESIRELISSNLTDAGYNVIKAVNGQDGLDKLNTDIKLIVTDLNMPIMDGYELCKALKTSIVTSHIPVMLLSAKNSTESRIAGLETEADIYMSKPFNPLELQLQIRNIFNQHQKLKEKYISSESLIPEEAGSNSMEHQFLIKLSDLMEVNHQNPEYSVEKLSNDIGLSRSQLHRKLQALTNDSASKFIRTYRLKKALTKLKEKSASISEIAYDVGFNNVSYFNKCFLETFGYRPGEA